MTLLPKSSFVFTLYLQGTCTQFSNHFCYCFSLFNFRMTSDGSGSSFDQPFVRESSLFNIRPQLVWVTNSKIKKRKTEDKEENVLNKFLLDCKSTVHCQNFRNVILFSYNSSCLGHKIDFLLRVNAYHLAPFRKCISVLSFSIHTHTRARAYLRYLTVRHLVLFFKEDRRLPCTTPAFFQVCQINDVIQQELSVIQLSSSPSSPLIWHVEKIDIMP